MRFVLVNDRAPHPRSTCAQCGAPLVAGYVRDLSSRLRYCDHRCYPVATSLLSCISAGVDGLPIHGLLSYHKQT
jgi:hypothetical protein